MLLFLDAAGVTGWAHLGADGVLVSAILIPGGFFLSVIGHDPQRPNGVKALIWIAFALSKPISKSARHAKFHGRQGSSLRTRPAKTCH